jgi:8-oxo-dGDP phosphatase
MKTAPKKNGPWLTLSTELKYENPWLSVREDAVIHPNGKPGIFGIVTMPSGVSVLPIDNQGNVYLVSEYKYAVKGECIGTISGGCDGGEDLASAVKRELKEEAGITAGTLISLGYIDPFTTVVNSRNYLFLALDLQIGEAEPEGTESIQVLKVPFEQAVAWVMDSTISHGGSATCILKAQEYFKLTPQKLHPKE